MLWFLMGCSIGLSVFSTGSDTGVMEGGIVRPGVTAPGDAGDESGDGDDEPVDPDIDGDGYTVDDCDDLDATINPGEYDDCDGIDNDCDGRIDEDALWDEDPEQPILDLGAIEPGEGVVLSGLLAPEYDRDSIDFYVSDGVFGWFYIDAISTSLPADTDIKLTLILVEDASGMPFGPVAYNDDAGIGEEESIAYNGTAFWDDSGVYRLEIEAMSGSNCETPYEIELYVGS